MKKNMDKTRKIIKNLLLAFVLISIGFAFGKYSVKKTEADVDDTGESNESHSKDSYVQVYYMHSTFRCVSCNKIEEMTKNLLESNFHKELEDGFIKFSEVDFQKNEKLAKKFDIIASCVVVAKVENGNTTDFKRLDEVWTLMKDPPAFDKYISKAIDSYLKEVGGEK